MSPLAAVANRAGGGSGLAPDAETKGCAIAARWKIADLPGADAVRAARAAVAAIARKLREDIARKVREESGAKRRRADLRLQSRLWDWSVQPECVRIWGEVASRAEERGARGRARAREGAGDLLVGIRNDVEVVAVR